MRPSSLGGCRILRRTLVCPSVRPVIVYFFYSRTVLRANIQNRKTSVFAYGPASRMYFSARTEGRISYSHLGRTNLLQYILCKSYNNFSNSLQNNSIHNKRQSQYHTNMISFIDSSLQKQDAYHMCELHFCLIPFM